MMADHNADRDWIRALEHISKYGNRVSPRGMLVYESVAFMSTVSMRCPVIMNEHRNLGYKFMAAEAAWILEGRNDVESIAPYSKVISNFSDDGVSFFGAYGPKVRNQIDYIVNNLYNDQFSRQAVINIWRENPPATKDVPCTLSLQFIIRHNIIHCVASMRSSDLWLGHPYDIVNFSAIAFYIMLKLNKKLHADYEPQLGLGQLYLTAGSKHLYERNAADAGMVLEHFYNSGLPRETGDAFRPELYHEPDEFIAHLWECAQSDVGMKGMF